jgi:DNA repair protein RadC
MMFILSFSRLQRVKGLCAWLFVSTKEAVKHGYRILEENLLENVQFEDREEYM